LASEGIGIGAHIQLSSFLGDKGNEERILSKDNKRRGLFLLYFWKDQQQWALGVGQDRNPTRKETTQNTHTHTLWDVGSKETGVQFWKLNFQSSDDLHYAEFTKSLL
jgi:hypothetical protein